MSKSELSFEKSEEQAEIIKSISFLVAVLDTKYCRKAAKGMIDQASRQESIAVLNPNHPQKKNEILRWQGLALRHLSDYVESLKEVEKCKLELSKENELRNEINGLFL